MRLERKIFLPFPGVFLLAPAGPAPLQNVQHFVQHVLAVFVGHAWAVVAHLYAALIRYFPCKGGESVVKGWVHFAAKVCARGSASRPPLISRRRELRRGEFQRCNSLLKRRDNASLPLDKAQQSADMVGLCCIASLLVCDHQVALEGDNFFIISAEGEEKEALPK